MNYANSESSALDDNRTIVIVAKSPGEPLTAVEKAAIDMINAAGGLAFVARSVDDVRRALRAEGVVT